MRRKIKCGIYKITSPTGRIYIGSSKDIQKRWWSYFSKNCKDQPKLYNSLCKYGVEKHTFEIIEYCEFEILFLLERAWGLFYNVLEEGLNCTLPGYNEIPRLKSKETILKMSIARMGVSPSEATREKLRKANLGKKQSKEVIEKRTACQKGKKASLEAIEKRCEKLRKIVLDIQTGVYYESAKEAAQYNNHFSKTSIISMLNGNTPNKTYLRYT
jgi:group I intron endonuclease